MIMPWLARLAALISLYHLCCRLVIGRRYLMVALYCLIWPVIQLGLLAVGWQDSGFTASDVQNRLVGFPLYVCAVVLGVTLVTKEIEHKTLEVSLTLPGGVPVVIAHKLIATLWVLALCLCVLLVVNSALFVTTSLMVSVRIMQGCVFLLVCATVLGAVIRSVLVAAVVMMLVLMMVTYYSDSVWSPVFNPLLVTTTSSDSVQMMQLKNHVVFVLLTIALGLMGFIRIENRTALLR